MIPCPTPRPLARLALRRRAIQDLGVVPELSGTLSPQGPGDPRSCRGLPVHVSGRGVRMYGLCCINFQEHHL